MAKHRVEVITEQLLAGVPVVGVTQYHKLCNDLMREYLDVVTGDLFDKYVRGMRLKDQIKTAAIMFHYRPTDTGMNPKQVPVEYLKWAVQHPLMQPSFISKEQRARADSPIKAIRQFCMNCQGNDAAGVRECARINCQFWPFRMGSNVFFGRLADSEREMSDAEVEREEEEFEDANQEKI